MKINDLIHNEVIAIDGFICTTFQKETGKTITTLIDNETIEVGDVIVLKVVEIGNVYDGQETYGMNFVEVIKKTK
jgi:hypothetical protein